MKTIRFIFILALTFLTSNSFTQEREITELLTGWKFSKGKSEIAWQIAFDDSDWQNINIPHDWAIEGPFITDGDGNTGKLPWKGEGWYRKKIDIPEDYINKRLYLLFDGIMAFPEIYINGDLVGKWDYGYNSFFLDISNIVNIGEENPWRFTLIPETTKADGTPVQVFIEKYR